MLLTTSYFIISTGLQRHLSLFNHYVPTSTMNIERLLKGATGDSDSTETSMDAAAPGNIKNWCINCHANTAHVV